MAATPRGQAGVGATSGMVTPKTAGGLAGACRSVFRRYPQPVPPAGRGQSMMWESLQRPLARSLRFHFTASWRRAAGERADQPGCRRGHGIDGLIESLLVGARRLVRSTQLPDKLDRRQPDLILRSWRLKIRQALDATAHSGILSACGAGGDRGSTRNRAGKADSPRSPRGISSRGGLRPPPGTPTRIRGTVKP